MTIYTRRGDRGTTSLADGTRTSKSSPRVEAYGTIDEANSHIGSARAAVTDGELDAILRFIQQRLFNCSSALSTPAGSDAEQTPTISDEDVTTLEAAIDRFQAHCGPLDHFILQAGCEAATRLHVARAGVRRAERRVVHLAEEEAVDEHILAFINRTSDALFAAARFADALDGRIEERWDPAYPVAPRGPGSTPAQ
jgi:cob(I)alamin adenosyltransferase